MRNGLIVMACLFSFAARAGGDENDYAVANIPASLLKNACVVKRMESLRFEISDDNRAKYILKVAYTILNEQGKRWYYFSRGYAKLCSIDFSDG